MPPSCRLYAEVALSMQPRLERCLDTFLDQPWHLGAKCPHLMLHMLRRTKSSRVCASTLSSRQAVLSSLVSAVPLRSVIAR
jgi:hypothetical protein